jgi:hypothetical protein
MDRLAQAKSPLPSELPVSPWDSGSPGNRVPGKLCLLGWEATSEALDSV